MKITFLGTGTSQGIPVINCQCNVCKSNNSKDNRLRTSVWVETDNNSFLIDIGPDFRQQALRNGISKIDAILLTHEHADHTAGLDDIRPINFTMQKQIPLLAESRVINDLKQRFYYAFGGSDYPGLPQLDLIEIKPEQSFVFNGDEIVPIRISHGKLEILAFRILDLVYITDANFISDQVMNQIKGCKILVINALRQKKHHSHFSLDQALDTIKRIQPLQTYIIHISHQLGLYNQIEPTLPSGVHLAYDGLQIQCK